MRKYLAVEKAKLLGNPFIDSQSNFALLTWMLFQKTLYLKIVKIHHKRLRIIYQSNASYRNLIECNGSTSFHQRHLQFLLTKVYKSAVTTNPVFREREAPINLRKVAVFFLALARSTTPGKNSAHFRGTLIWNQLPSSIKSSKSIIEF